MRARAEELLRNAEDALDKEKRQRVSQQTRSATIRTYRAIYEHSDLSLDELLGQSVRSLANRMTGAGMPVPGVYFLRDDGWIKIGYSSDLSRRMKELNIAHAEELEVVGLLPGPRRIETQLHRAFDQLRGRGEWFKYESPLTEFIETTMQLAGFNPTPRDTTSLYRKTGESIIPSNHQVDQPGEIIEEMIRPLTDSNR